MVSCSLSASDVGRTRNNTYIPSLNFLDIDVSMGDPVRHGEAEAEVVILPPQSRPSDS